MNNSNKENIPFFSVIIPAYNAAEFIILALKSVYAQTCTNYEVIVINDGSTDDTATILSEERDSRLRIISQKNSGAAVARNRGIQEAKGRYLAFLDADDIWLPNHLSTAQYFFEKYPEYIWYSARSKRVQFISEDDFISTENCPRSYCICNWFLEADILECGSNFIIKASIAKEKKKFYSEGVQLCEDNIAWSKLALQYPMIGVPDFCTVLYRMWPGSAIHRHGNNPSALQPVFQTHQQILSTPNCPREAKLYITRFSCAQWLMRIRSDSMKYWRPEIKSRRTITGQWISAWITLNSYISEFYRRLIGKVLRYHINHLERKMKKMAQAQHIILN